MTGTVYALAAPGRIKIGFTRSLRRRLAEIEGPYRVLGALPGSFQNERSLHRLLKGDEHDSHHRTWYRRTTRVRWIVREILSPSFQWRTCQALLDADARYYKTNIKAEFRYLMTARPTFPTPISDLCRKNLLMIARAYARSRRVSLNQVSKEVYGNVKFLEEFARKRQSVSLLKYDQMIQRFRSVWPEDVLWPACQAIVILPPGR